MTPSDTSANGIHTPNGKFATGNPGGPGNPHGGQVARLRAAMLDVVGEDDMRAVVLKLVELAKGGDLRAIDLLLNRTLGKADGGPLVAIQMNQTESGSGESPGRGRVAAIIEKLRAARGDAPADPNAPFDPERERARFQKRLDALPAEPEVPITLECKLAELDRRIERLNT